MICDHRFCKICIKTIQIKAINDSAVCRDDRRNDLFYQLEAENLSNYGKLFEQAFYLTENGHLLSASMKNF